MAEVLVTRFQLRRGYEATWEKNNPILASGEPGFVIDKNLLKIGDGVKTWKELDYIGDSNSSSESDVQSGVYNADTKEDFPAIGDVSIIYKARIEKQLYQWNPDTMEYEILAGTDISTEETLILYGGSASDLVEVLNG